MFLIYLHDCSLLNVLWVCECEKLFPRSPKWTFSFLLTNLIQHHTTHVVLVPLFSSHTLNQFVPEWTECTCKLIESACGQFHPVLSVTRHTSKFTVLNSVKDRKWVGEREDNPKSSVSYNTQDRPDNWLKYVAAAELNNHITVKGNKKREFQWKIGCCQWIVNFLNVTHIAVSVYPCLMFSNSHSYIKRFQ